MALPLLLTRVVSLGRLSGLVGGSSAGSVNLRFIGLRDWISDARGNSDRVKAELRKQVRDAGKVVKESAKSQFGGRMSDANRKRISRSSQLGVYSGRLKASIGVRVTIKNSSNWKATIQPRGAPGRYGTVHELGGYGKYPKRAFLEPAVIATTEEVFRMLGKSIKVIR